MKDTLGLILLAGGAFAIYEIFFSTPAATVPATSTGTTPTTANTNTNTVSQIQSPSAPNTQANSTPAPVGTPSTPIPSGSFANIQDAIALGLAANNSGGTLELNVDQWNYYYNNMSGKIPITGDQMNAMLNTLTSLGYNRNTIMTEAQWTYLLNKAGLNGLSGLGRVYLSGFHGPIIPRGLGVIGAGYGINQLQGSDGTYWERAVKVHL